MNQDTMYRLTLLVALASACTLCFMAALVWVKFAALPAGAKVLVILGVLMLIGVSALIVGFVAEDQLLSLWNGSIDRATDAFMRFDGFAREHPMVGVAFGMVIPLLLLTTSDGLSHQEGLNDDEDPADEIH